MPTLNAQIRKNCLIMKHYFSALWKQCTKITQSAKSACEEGVALSAG